MARRQTPPEWEQLMESAGISSLRQLAVAAGISQTTASRTVHGDHVSEPETVSAIAKALRVPESDIYKLTHGQVFRTAHWEPPAEVYRLSRRSQDAVTEMIRAMAAEQDQREVMGNARSTAPMNEAGDEPAQEDYGLAADDSLQQGDYGRIGPDEVGHDT